MFMKHYLKTIYIKKTVVDLINKVMLAKHKAKTKY